MSRKKKIVGDQHAVHKKRNAPRYALKVPVTIDGFEGEGLLDNISVTGCRMESATYVSIKPDEVYQVSIKPNPGENIKPFKQKLKATWTKSSEDLFQAGFTLEQGQTGAPLRQYVQILNDKGVSPNYGNMKKDKK